MVGMEKFSLSKRPVLEEGALYNMCIEDGESRIPRLMSTVGIRRLEENEIPFGFHRPLGLVQQWHMRKC
jgi:hypothetical protein